MKSVRRALLVGLLGAMVLAMVVGAFATYRMARDELDEVFDYHLRQIAISLRDQVLAQTPGLAEPDTELEFVIQVWDREGTRVYLSRPHADLPDRARMGFADVRTADGLWRVFSIALRGQVIQVAQPMSVRNRLAAGAALRTMTPFALLVPVLALVVWHIVGRGLAPLDRIARAVGRRTPTALDAIPEAGVPREVRPLVRALNDLLARLGTALSAQRDFVADAAHELRTPLAALTLQLQLAERAGDEQERAAAMAELRSGLARTAHVVDQLLMLARQEPGATPTSDQGTVNLADLAGQTIADHLSLADARGIDLGAASIESSVAVEGDAPALRSLFANLVDNALRYSAEGGRVDVSVGTADGRAFVAVADTGPGIPPAERSRVFDRFYRGAGGTGTGSGLGLAIVKAIADRHRAEIALEDTPGGGLTVRVVFAPGPSA